MQLPSQITGILCLVNINHLDFEMCFLSRAAVKHRTDRIFIKTLDPGFPQLWLRADIWWCFVHSLSLSGEAVQEVVSSAGSLFCSVGPRGEGASTLKVLGRWGSDVGILLSHAGAGRTRAQIFKHLVLFQHVLQRKQKQKQWHSSPWEQRQERRTGFKRFIEQH